MKEKIPLRRPLILTHSELLWLMNKVVGDRHDDLKRFLVRGQSGQRSLREAVAFLNRLQRKLWRV